MFDLRSKYAFDASEGQIPEGAVSVYGPANSHANCVPASFTAALLLAGFPDIDPQHVTNEIYGPNYRGGFGDFQRMIAWIAANVQGAPSFSDEPFSFDRAEAAGQAGQLMVVAGWINPASVTFTTPSQANGFSHASLLVAHLAGDKYVIWNAWFGQLQTYDRAVLAASLYEMSVMAGLHGAGSEALNKPTRRAITLATANSLHQFCRGTDKALFHRQRSAGTWSAWKSLGGKLSTDVIGGGIDETGALVVTVVATDGSFVDITSADDGATWSAFSPSGGGGDGLLTISAGAPAVSGQALDLKVVLDAIAAIKVPTTITGKLA